MEVRLGTICECTRTNRNHTIRNSDRTQVRGAVATTYKNIVDDNKILRCEDVFKPWSTFKDRLVNMGNEF